jgi:TonB family protein
MFKQLQPDASQQRRALAASLVAHALLFGWLLYSALPKVLSPSSVRAGRSDGVVTQLYWPANASSLAAGDVQASATNPDEAPRKRLIWQRAAKTRRQKHRPPTPLSQAETETTASTQIGGTAAKGMPYGTLGSGAASGDEIRPALPVNALDPVLDPAELPAAEGSVIVEVTIDDKGNIIQKTVIESLSPAIDAKVLAALESWRFLPATRNGVAIPSKQDVYYHFRPRA